MKPGHPTRFLVDAMHGTLAKKLRMFGFDIVFNEDGTDAELLDLASAQSRIVLTSDIDLIRRCAKNKIPVIEVSGSTDPQRLKGLLLSASDAGVPLVRGEPRCSVCGGLLVIVNRAEVAGEVPEGVARSHRLFRRCNACRKIYYRGSHWKRLRSMERLLPKKSST